MLCFLFVDCPYCIVDYGDRVTPAKEALSSTADAVFSRYAKDDKYGARLNVRQTCRSYPSKEDLCVWIVEYVEAIFLQRNLPVRQEVLRNNKSFLVRNYQAG